MKTQTGDVETISNLVRVAFKDKRKEADGSYYLDAMSVVQIKKNNFKNF